MLPDDNLRQVMWRFADRYDLQMAVQSSRSMARGIVARLVAEGARNTHEWTKEKAELLKAFDESGLTALYMEPEQGGFIMGPKNLAMALVAFELSWVDAGAVMGRRRRACSESGQAGTVHHQHGICQLRHRRCDIRR
jgi:alkylation response protein AidB-like acyl-CoA dehydrogenase